MQIDHITFSQSGGAGLVARNLVYQQQSLGFDSRLFSVIATSLHLEPFSHPILTYAAALDKYAVARQSQDTLFSLFRSRIGVLNKETLRPDSVLHFHWINGVITSKDVETFLESGRRVVWTLHDMAPFTGGCHHSHDCNGYVTDCENCPQSRAIFHKKIELHKKADLLLRDCKNLTLVTPSIWMESKARASRKFGGMKVVTIPNPISHEFLRDSNKEEARAKLKINSDTVVFIAVATNLQDPAKNIQEIVRTFHSTKSSATQRIELLLVGSGGGAHHSPASGVTWLGEMSPSALAQIVSAADWVLSSSVAESAGMTIAECGAMGVPAIVIDAGGLCEMLLPSKSGLVARELSEFEALIRLAASNGIDQKAMGHQAKLFSRSKFGPKEIANSYLNVYRQMYKT